MYCHTRTSWSHQQNCDALPFQDAINVKGPANDKGTAPQMQIDWPLAT